MLTLPLSTSFNSTTMTKLELLKVPLSCMFNGRRKPIKSKLELLPPEVLRIIAFEIDLISRINLARCSRHLVKLSASGRLLQYDPDNVLAADEQASIEAISFHVRPPKLLKTMMGEATILSQGDLKCDYCGWHQEYTSAGGRSSSDI